MLRAARQSSLSESSGGGFSSYFGFGEASASQRAEVLELQITDLQVFFFFFFFCFFLFFCFFFVLFCFVLFCILFYGVDGLLFSPFVGIPSHFLSLRTSFRIWKKKLLKEQKF